MQEKIEQLLRKISKEKGIPLSELIKAYKAPYEMMRNTWKQINFAYPASYEEVNFYIMGLGTFFIHEPKIRRINGQIRNAGQAKEGKPRDTNTNTS